MLFYNESMLKMVSQVSTVSNRPIVAWMEFESGWFARDVRRASERLSEWGCVVSDTRAAMQAVVDSLNTNAAAMAAAVTANTPTPPTP